MSAIPRIVLTVLAVVLLTEGSRAQSSARILDVELGTHVSDLPLDEWVNPSCGTNGGPPSIELRSFAEFARCPVEAATGLREVWFIYDDEWEYIARAYRDPVEIRSYSANVFFQQPIITSLLVDEGGLVQGYRMITDPEAPEDLRREAYSLFSILRQQFGTEPWRCEDLPPAARETAIEGVFLKSDCVNVSEQRFVWLSGRHLRKAGQSPREYAGQRLPPGSLFDSSVRLEVFALDAVRNEPCCQALIPG
jgi:hypothetical protein